MITRFFLLTFLIASQTQILFGQSALEHSFKNIPDTIQTSAYWYWLSDNISKEGVIKDLQAMKKAGINRAFIGNIGIDDVPYGKVKLLSDEWWDILHTALKTATQLNIEIGIFNGPGWSQSGGPWVKPGQSMRYISSSQKEMHGPAVVNTLLEKPAGAFQDVKVIAFKSPLAFNKDSIAHPLNTDSNAAVLEFKSDTAFTARSLVLYPNNKNVNATLELQAKENGVFTTIKTFVADRHNSALNVGFEPFGPIAIAVPATTSASFRLLLKSSTPGLYFNEIKIAGTPVVESFVEKTLGKMFQDPLPYWKEYQWPVQPVTDNAFVIDPKSVIDISAFMKADGTLAWNVPAGDWIVQRTGMLPTGVTNAPASKEGTGAETDKMSKAHIKSHFDAFMGQIIKRIPLADRLTWKVVVEDSYETGGQNWTDDMAEKFKSVYHYDPVPYLPAMNGLVVGSADQSDRFLWDLRRLIADRVAYDYVGGLSEISHKYGLHTWLESYGHWGFPGEFLQYGGQSDEIGGEFWSEGTLGDIENRAASSSAHIYGKTKVSAESFTAAGKTFGRFPYMMKQRGDRFFTEAINNTLLHVYIHQPDERQPGMNAWFGNEFNRHNTWFGYMDLFTAYLKRCNFMLQQGKYAADVAYFIGEDAPKMTGITSPALPKGYAFDYINAEVILNSASVKDGKLVLPDGMSYQLLVLPPLATMRPAVLKKMVTLAGEGVHIIGQLPERSPSLEDYPKADEEVKILAKQLAANASYLSSNDIAAVLSQLGINPDFKQLNGDSMLFIHRQLTGSDIYFLSNQKNETIETTASFRINDMQPSLWDPVTGETRLLPQFANENGRTEIPIRAEPYQSMFIVFSNKKSNSNMSAKKAKTNFPEPATIVKINKPCYHRSGN